MKTTQISEKQAKALEKVKKYFGASKIHVTDEDLRRTKDELSKKYMKEWKMKITPEDEKRILKKYEKILKKH